MSFQTFTASTRPDQGPPRIAALRDAMEKAGLQGFLVPRNDAHQGEYVAPADERLAWLTGFTGSAGHVVVLPEAAGLFVDGRYTIQARQQVDTDIITPLSSTKVETFDWVAERLAGLKGAKVGYDPWLMTQAQVEKAASQLDRHDIAFVPAPDLIAAIWTDRPDLPMGQVSVQPEVLTGRGHPEKRAELADNLKADGQAAAVLTLPDSIAWLLNIRGSDVGHNPVPHAFAVLHDDATLDLFIAAEKVAGIESHFGNGVRLHAAEAFEEHLGKLGGTIRLDKNSAPAKLTTILEATPDAQIAYDSDPCILPKARKTAAEIAGTRTAHLRDGAAMCRFLHWFDRNAAAGKLTEIDCVRALEGFREETGALRDISFDTIAGAGPHGAIVHYRVTEDTNAALLPGQLFLIDSGAQYVDGTTDVTRTLPVGEVGHDERTAFTQVLRGMIGLSRLRFPKGLAGRDIDAIARAPLWAAGRDYDHGTGHGVGAYLSVHEGPARIARTGTVPLESGMILSNEPGYYREDAFGIRIENLIIVSDAEPSPDGDDRAMFAFETLTYVPIDRRLIDAECLTPDERDWLNAYHAAVLDRIGPLLDGDDRTWLATACAPI